MKVLAILIVVVSSAAALGSGPYLPSGWRPDGPAFFLPGEVTSKPSENPVKETLFQESEASGSNFFREYGPPKIQDVSQDITQQALPEVVTEQAFAAIQARINQEVVENKEVVDAVTESDATTAQEVITNQISTVAEELESATEAVTAEEITTEQAKEELQGRAIKLEVEASIAETTDGFVDAAVVTESDAVVTEQQDAAGVVVQSAEQNAKVEQDNEAKTVVGKIQQDIVRNVEKTIEENVEQTVKILDEEIKSIAQQIVKVENEAVQEQNVGVSGVKSIQVSRSVEQVPEGFLEYGPPGFKEYGPPKGDELLRSAAVQEKSESELIQNNETRRRRFSPKFRPNKKH